MISLAYLELFFGHEVLLPGEQDVGRLECVGVLLQQGSYQAAAQQLLEWGNSRPAPPQIRSDDESAQCRTEFRWNRRPV